MGCAGLCLAKVGLGWGRWGGVGWIGGETRGGGGPVMPCCFSSVNPAFELFRPVFNVCAPNLLELVVFDIVVLAWTQPTP